MPDELLPVVVQEVGTKEILMLAYANAEALELTKSTGFAHFYSRSRGRIWKKGEESGNTMRVLKILQDCDADALIYLVEFPKEKVACHTGSRTCFFTTVFEAPEETEHSECEVRESEGSDLAFLIQLKALVDERKVERPRGSYTTELFEAGLEKILKKLGEESIEVVLAGCGEDKEHLVYEIADLIYHLTVLMSYKNLRWKDVIDELKRRHGRSGKTQKARPEGENGNEQQERN